MIHNNNNNTIENRLFMHLQNNHILTLDRMQFCLNHMTIRLQKSFISKNDTVIKLIELHDERLLTVQRNS